eukprot:gene5637-biopygen9640
MGPERLEWNYSVTCHGACDCDPAGGNFLHAVDEEQRLAARDWSRGGAPMEDGDIPMVEAKAIHAFMSSGECLYMTCPNSDPRSEHPVVRRTVHYMPSVPRPARPDPIGIPDVRYGVYQVSDRCPAASVAYRRISHYDCCPCDEEEFDKCPLVHAGKWKVHKF